MKQQKRKGFTLVELLVVIAILAVLATVSIVGYMSFIKKANISNDMALVKQINDLLLADETVDGKPATMQDALNVIEENGFVIEKLTPTADGHEFVYDIAHNRFALLDENGKPIYSTGELSTDSAQLWTIVEDASTISDEPEHSLFITVSIAEPLVLNKLVGVEVAENCTIDTLEITDESSTSEVTIAGNIKNCTVNAPSGNVNHYGKIDNLKITTIAPKSWHENGTVVALEVNDGHLELSAQANVETVVVKSTDAVSITANVSTVIVLDSASTAAITIESTVPVCVDNNTAGVEVNMPTDAIAPTVINSEADFTTKKQFEIVAGRDIMTSANANILSGYYKLASDIEVSEILLVEEGATAIIDLNGHKLISNFEGITICNYGDLTVNDSSDGNGLVYNKNLSRDNGNFGHDAIRNYGILTINGGTFGDQDTDRTNDNQIHIGAALRTQAGSTTIVNGGYFTCGDNYGRNWANKPQMDSQNNDFNSYAIRSFGNLEINNATVYGKMNGGVSANAGSITIYGGNFSVSAGTNTFHTLTRENNGAASYYIYGGTFSNDGSASIAGVLSCYKGMPSNKIDYETAETNGYFIYGGTFVDHGTTVSTK